MFGNLQLGIKLEWTKVQFWLDRWCGSSPLADLYPDLFRICCNKEASVVDLMRFTNGVLHWDF